MKKNRLIAYAALTGLAVLLVAHATEIETFDNPDLLQTNGGTYILNRDGGSFTAFKGAVQTFAPTYYELSTTGGYGTGWHDIYSVNTPPPGKTNGVIDISGNNTLQLDVSLNNHTQAGLFIDMTDGEGDFWKYFFGFGLTGNAANDNADPAGHQFVTGEVVTQGAQANEEILQVPLLTPFHDINGSGTFDFSQLVNYRIENDPGATGGVGNASDVSYNDLSAINVVVGGSVWNFNGSGDWNTPGNWANGVVPNGVGAEADFFSVITAPATVSTNVAVTAGLLNFNNTNTYTIGGTGSLTLQTSSGNAQVIVQAGAQHIGVPLTIASNTVFNISSGASLSIASPLTINAGESLTQSGAGTVSYQSSISVLDGGSITFASASHATGLSLATNATAAIAPRSSGGPTILQLDSLSFNAASSKLDVSNQELIVTATPSTIRNELHAGNIVTSRSGGALGYKDIGGANTEVLFTLAGDADLSGKVDVGDLGALATSYGATANAVWAQGDFNYDGKVDVGDLGALATNYGATAGLGSGATSPAAAASFASAAVPEPAALGVMSIATSLLTLRRRRNA